MIIGHKAFQHIYEELRKLILYIIQFFIVNKYSEHHNDIGIKNKCFINHKKLLSNKMVKCLKNFHSLFPYIITIF